MSEREIILLLCLLGGFLSGSIMFSRIVPLWLNNVDVCLVSNDHNPGAANVFVSCGWKMGMLCLLLDMLKGFVPVYVALSQLQPDSYFLVLVLAAPVLGHAIAPLNHFRGGKCIATIFGEMIALLKFSPVGLVLAGLYILFSTVVKIDPHRRRSIVTFTLFGVAALLLEVHMGRLAVGVGCAVVSTVAVLKHLGSPQ